MSVTIETALARGSLRRRMASDTAVLLLGGGTERVLNFATQVVIARALGPVGFGLYSLGYAVVTLLNLAGMMGLHVGVVRFGSLYYAQAQYARLKGVIVSAVGTALLLALALAAALAAGAPWLAAAFDDGRLTSIFRMFALALPLGVAISMVSALARALQSVRPRVWVEHLFQPAANLVLAGGAVLLGYGVVGAVFGYGASVALGAAAITLWVLRLVPSQVRGVPATREAGLLLRFSGVAFLATVFRLLLTRVDRFMLGIYHTASDVGIYSAGASIAVQMDFLLVPALIAFAPLIAPLYEAGRREEIAGLFRETTRWLTLVTLPLLVAMTLYAPQIVGLFGGRFAGAAPVLVFLVVGTFIDAATGPVGVLLQMTGRQTTLLTTNAMSLVLNVLLNLALVPPYGAVGAAVGTAVSIALSNIARLALVWRHLRMLPYDRRFLAPLGVSAASWLILWGLGRVAGAAWWLLGLGFLAAYAAAALRFGLSGADRQTLRRLLARRALAGE